MASARTLRPRWERAGQVTRDVDTSLRDFSLLQSLGVINGLFWRIFDHPRRIMVFDVKMARRACPKDELFLEQSVNRQAHIQPQHMLARRNLHHQIFARRNSANALSIQEDRYGRINLSKKPKSSAGLGQ